MKKDKKIAGLYVIAVVFAIISLLLFGKAFLSETEMPGQKESGDASNVTENQGNVVNPVENNQVVDLSAQSISLDEFNALFKGEGGVKSEKAVIEGVPVNIFYTDMQDAMPIVIMQHGLEANKDSISELANSFAMQGYVVITPDAVGYGDLADGNGRTVAEILEGTAQNFEKVLDFVCQSEHIDENRVGLCGVSLGGLTSLYYAANGEHDVDVVVSFCATPDFTSFAGAKAVSCYYTDKNSMAEKDGEKVKSMEENMISLSPYDKLMSKENLALFLMCGAEDQVVPPEGNVTFYQEATAAGKNVGLVVKDNQGHSVEVDEMYAALAFMVENL